MTERKPKVETALQNKPKVETRGRKKGQKDSVPRKKAAIGNRPCDYSPITKKIDLPEGENAKLVGFLAEIASWPKVDPDDMPGLEARFQKYLSFCAERDIKVGNQTCYLALGISNDQAYDWSNGFTKDSVHADFLKKVKRICGSYREMLMQENKVNAVVGIFWQKNYDGLKDQQDVVVAQNNPMGETPDAEALQKYVASLPATPTQKVLEAEPQSYTETQKEAESEPAGR